MDFRRSKRRPNKAHLGGGSTTATSDSEQSANCSNRKRPSLGFGGSEIGWPLEQGNTCVNNYYNWHFKKMPYISQEGRAHLYGGSICHPASHCGLTVACCALPSLLLLKGKCFVLWRLGLRRDRKGDTRRNLMPWTCSIGLEVGSLRCFDFNGNSGCHDIPQEAWRAAHPYVFHQFF